MAKMGIVDYLFYMSLIGLAIVAALVYFAFQGEVWAIVIVTVLSTLFVVIFCVALFVIASEYIGGRNRTHAQNDLTQEVKLLGNMSQTMLRQNNLLNKQVEQNLLGESSGQDSEPFAGFEWIDDVEFAPIDTGE